MIQKSFIFLEKVGSRKERNIWVQGIKDWNDFLLVGNKGVKGISDRSKEYYDRKIQEAKDALLREDSSYFVGKLASKEMWRLYDYFREEVGYLDIEIDSYGKITVVGVSDYYNSNFFVKGVNLDRKVIERELSKYKIIITFNGGAFDLPKLRKELGVVVGVPHIDLKPLCVNMGLLGGLKEIERILGLGRPTHLYGNPVELWRSFHASGDREYLDLLIDYNREDIENLKAVMDHVYGRMKEEIRDKLEEKD